MECQWCGPASDSEFTYADDRKHTFAARHIGVGQKARRRPGYLLMLTNRAGCTASSGLHIGRRDAVSGSMFERDVAIGGTACTGVRAGLDDPQ